MLWDCPNPSPATNRYRYWILVPFRCHQSGQIADDLQRHRLTLPRGITRISVTNSRKAPQPRHLLHRRAAIDTAVETSHPELEG